MKNLITLASLTLLLTACGGGPGVDSSDGGSDGGPAVMVTGAEGQNPDTTTPATSTDDQNPDTASPALEYTADLRSSADFDFSSSRAIAIDFDVAAASTSPGLMSLCTKYTKTDDSFDVDYNSCTVQAPLENGLYSGKMDVTNDINSVIGVVWFKDETIQPVYKEFSLEVGAKLARRGEGAQSIVWR